MSEDEAQRALVKERLTAAECEEELCRCEDENQRKQELLEPVLSPGVELLQAAVQTSPGPELNHGLMEETPEILQIKEEPEEQSIKEEEEQLPVSVPEFITVCVKTEEFSPLQQTEIKEEETQGKDIGAEPHLHSETDGDTEHSSDNDEEWGTPLSCSDNGDEYNQLQIRRTAEQITVLSSKPKSAPESGANKRNKSGAAKGAEGKTHQCPVCKKSLKGNQHDLQRHIQIHSGEKPYSCSICKREFTFHSALKRHMIVHTGEKPFGCYICKRQFAHKSALKRHMSQHTGGLPFSCLSCNKTFPDQSNLSVHVRTHTGERPYSCSVCDKTFSLMGNLNTHRLTHTGEKLFSCSVCEREFAHHCALKRHMVVHTGDRPFSCSVCHKTFSTKTDLCKHIRTHTGERPFSCSACDKTFSQVSSLNVHRKTHTGNDSGVLPKQVPSL